MTGILNRVTCLERHTPCRRLLLAGGNEQYLSDSLLLVQTGCEEENVFLLLPVRLLETPIPFVGKANSQSRKPFEMLIHTQTIYHGLERRLSSGVQC